MPGGPDLVLDAKWLQEGDAEAKRAPLGLLLVFQMNCPRSFRHALPALNRVASRRSPGAIVRAIAISTATDDFKLNTERNTLALLEASETVGEVLRAGIDEFDLDERIAVGFDRLTPGVDPADAREVRARAELRLAEAGLEDPRILALDARAREELVRSLEEHVRAQTFEAQTYRANRCRATPTFLLFDNRGGGAEGAAAPILRQWSTHAPDDALDRWIAEAYASLA